MFVMRINKQQNNKNCQQNQQQAVLRMSSKARSKNATSNNKSCKNHSIQTKQESVARFSPKAVKKQHSKKFKQEKIIKQPIIKSSSKLNALVNTISNKLLSFQNVPQSNLISLLNSTNATTSPTSSYKATRRLQIVNKGQGKETLALIQNMSKQSLCKDQQSIKLIDESQAIKQHSYTKLLDSALSKPHHIKRLKAKAKQILSNEQNKYDLLQNVKQFKNEQNKNWQNLNKQLMEYLSRANTRQFEQQRQKQEKQIKQKLLKQGKTNYRWLQIQDRMNLQDYSAINTPNSQKTPIIIKDYAIPKSQQQSSQQIQILQRNDEPIADKIYTKCFQIENYTWQDEEVFSTSDVLQRSNVLSQAQYVSINTADLINQSLQVQQQVQVILNWLLDQFVVELARRLDFTRLRHESNSVKVNVNKQSNQDDQYKQFLCSINQMAHDCEQVRQIQNPDKKASAFITHALIEMAHQYPTQSNTQIKNRLIKSICNRQLDINELYLPEQAEQQEWIKMSFIYQLDDLIWQSLIQEQLNYIIK